MLKISNTSYVCVWGDMQVCEMYCGKVPDVEKWDEAQIGHYIGIGKMTVTLV